MRSTRVEYPVNDTGDESYINLPMRPNDGRIGGKQESVDVWIQEFNINSFGRVIENGQDVLSANEGS